MRRVLPGPTVSMETPRVSPAVNAARLVQLPAVNPAIGRAMSAPVVLYELLVHSPWKDECFLLVMHDNMQAHFSCALTGCIVLLCVCVWVCVRNLRFCKDVRCAHEVSLQPVLSQHRTRKRSKVAGIELVWTELS